MKRFDEDYQLLASMYGDGYFPDFFVDTVKNQRQNVFDEIGSELETAARDSTGETVEYILNWFELDIDAEDAIRNRDW